MAELLSDADIFGVSEPDSGLLSDADIFGSAPESDIGRLETAGSQFVRGAADVVASVPKSMSLIESARAEAVVGAFDKIDSGAFSGPDDPRLMASRAFANPDYQDDLKAYFSASDEDKQKLRQKYGAIYSNPQEQPLYKKGEAISEGAAERFPVNPEYADEFWAGTVPQGLGSATGFLGTGVLGRAAGLSAAATAAGAGAAVGGAGQFEEALNDGATLEEAFEAGKLSAFVGTSEAVPITGLLNRLDKVTGGGVKKVFADALKQGTEEAIQEAFQTISNNLIASDLVGYDPERGTFTGAGEASGAGFTVGALMQTVAAMVMPGRYRKSPNEAAPEGTQEQPAPEAPRAPLTEEDHASPLPDDLISEGKGLMDELLSDQDAGIPEGAVNADTILGAEQAQPVPVQPEAMQAEEQAPAQRVRQAEMETGLLSDNDVFPTEESVPDVPVPGEAIAEGVEGAMGEQAEPTLSDLQGQIAELQEQANAPDPAILPESTLSTFEESQQPASAGSGITPDFEPQQYVAALKRYATSTKKPLSRERIAKDLKIEPGQADRVIAALVSQADAPITVSKDGTVRRRAQRKGPIDAITYLADRGGINDNEGHDLKKGRNLQRFVPQAGPFIRKNGMSIDEAGESLWDAGYFGPTDTTARPTEAEVLDFLEQAHGGRGFAPEDQDQVDAAALAREEEERTGNAENEIRQIAKDMGEILGKSEIETIKEMMISQNMDAETAAEVYIERLAIQAVEWMAEETSDDSYTDNAEDIPFETAREPAARDQGREGVTGNESQGQARTPSDGQDGDAEGFRLTAPESPQETTDDSQADMFGTTDADRMASARQKNRQAVEEAQAFGNQRTRSDKEQAPADSDGGLFEDAKARDQGSIDLESRPLTDIERDYLEAVKVIDAHKMPSVPMNKDRAERQRLADNIKALDEEYVAAGGERHDLMMAARDMRDQGQPDYDLVQRMEKAAPRLIDARKDTAGVALKFQNVKDGKYVYATNRKGDREQFVMPRDMMESLLSGKQEMVGGERFIEVENKPTPQPETGGKIEDGDADARTQAVGLLSGGRVKQITDAGYRFVYLRKTNRRLTKDEQIKFAGVAGVGTLRDIEGAGMTVVPPDREATASGDTPAGKIEDFGEVLEGARKHYAQAYLDRMDEAMGTDIAAVPLSKAWPEPDYQKLLEDGADPWTVAFIHSARDEVPSKPRQKWKLARWVQQVESLRNFASKLMAGEITKERVQEVLREDKYKRLTGEILPRVTLYQEVGHSKSLKGVRLGAGEYSLIGGVKYDPPLVRWTVSKASKASAFSNWPMELGVGKTREEAIADFKANYDKIDINPAAKKQVKFDIYSRRGEEGFIVGKKIGRNHVDLERFDDLKVARAYIVDSHDKLVAKLERIKDIPDHRSADNEPRVGEDHRGGADVTAEQFSEAFGFRGVQFGNYVEGPKRQQDLNQAYDALMDMAGVLGIPAKALSLHGELGLAFGARGKGGKAGSSAHYERGNVVINLTKRDGAGSLAHEWWHAVDNYFSRKRDDKDNFMSERAYERGEGVRPEVVAAFKELTQSINRTSLKERAGKLDRLRTKDYWTTGREMSARAFESYIIAKLQDQSAKNDYLANVVSEEYWEAAEALGIGVGDGQENSYPYPTAAEIPEIRAGFDHLFDTIETRETDQGVEMYSLRRDITDTPAFKEWFGDSKVVDEDGKPLVVYHGTNEDVEAFDASAGASATGAGDARKGFFFSSSPAVASSYADFFNPYSDSRVGQLYAKINEGLVSLFGKTAIVSGGNVMPVYLSIQNPFVLDFQGKEYSGRAFGDAIDAAKEAGHDGVIIRNVQDDGFSNTDVEASDVYVPLRPTQIKSVNNRGTFDPEDPRISYRLGEGQRSAPSEDILDTVADDLKARLKERGIDDKISLRVVDSLATILPDGTQRFADASYQPGRKLITVALDAKDGKWALDHETIHALRDLGLFKDAEWRVLENAARNDRKRMDEIRKRYEPAGLTESQLEEEAIADMFADWTKGQKTFKGFIRTAFERIRAFLESLGNALEGNGYRTAADVFGDVGAGNVGNRPATGQSGNMDTKYAAAWHGTPHDFDVFKTDHIGTGEGAQAYGHGLYFAGKRDVAEFYRDKLSESKKQVILDGQHVGSGYFVHKLELPKIRGMAFFDLVERYAGQGEPNPLRKAIDDYQVMGDKKTGDPHVNRESGEVARKVVENLSRIEVRDPPKGRLYKVDLAPQEDEYLLWDKPLSEQSEKVRAAIKDALDTMVNHDTDFRRASALSRKFDDAEFLSQTADDFYRWLTSSANDPSRAAPIFSALGVDPYSAEGGRMSGSEAASKLLAREGIPGIKYLDGSSRNDGDGTYNYVIFDDSLVSVTEKFSLRPEAADSQENRNTVSQGFIARGQPLDRALRIPFDWFGGVDEKGQWQPGLKLYEKAEKTLTESRFKDDGVFGWLNGSLTAARTGILDRYGLSDDYVKRERKLDLDKREIASKGAEILSFLQKENVGADEAKVLQAVLTGEEIGDAEWNALAAPIRQAIDELGQEAVQLGLVSPESYERNRGTYLHRVYLKHEGDQPALARWFTNFMANKRKKIQGDAFKGRGIFLDVGVDRAMQDVTEFAEGKRGRPQKGEAFIILDKFAEEGGLVPAENDAATPAKIEKRVFWPADKAVPERYSQEGYVNRGEWEVRRTLGDKITLWRDFTKAERTQMGEILDARYTIGKTFTLMANDLATGRFYRDIAKNNEWARTATPNGKWVEAGDFKRMWQDESVEWVRVPDVSIPNTGGKKRWGALSGKYVRAEIWRDLNEADIMLRPNLWTKLLTQWKLNKTARSPVVHMNNVMSNMVFMDLADVRVQDLTKGLRSYINEDADFQEARDNGAFGSDIISQEIRRNVLQPILDDLQSEIAGGNPVTQKFGMLGKIAEAIWEKGKAFDRGMVDLYRMEDEVFRMAMYMRRRSLGDSAENAADEARAQFLDYDIRAPWVNTARRTVLPFIAYTYRAVPVIAKSVATRPWKMAKYFAMAYAANALAYMIAPGDEDEERNSMRAQEKGNTWIGTPRMMRMPYRDEHGNPVFLDIRRWIPAGDVFDMGQGHGAFPIPAPIQFGGPLMLGAELALNKSAFTGDEITNDLTDTAGDKAKKLSDWAWKSWMPSAAWIPGSWYWEKIGLAAKGATDSQGRPYPLPEAAASSFGIKLKPQDVEENYNWRMYEFTKARRALKAEERRMQRLYERGIMSDEYFEESMRAIDEKHDRINAEEDAIMPE